MWEFIKSLKISKSKLKKNYTEIWSPTINLVFTMLKNTEVVLMWRGSCLSYFYSLSGKFQFSSPYAVFWDCGHLRLSSSVAQVRATVSRFWNTTCSQKASGRAVTEWGLSEAPMVLHTLSSILPWIWLHYGWFSVVNAGYKKEVWLRSQVAAKPVSVLACLAQCLLPASNGDC